jgi:phosphate transport system protein
MVNTHIASAFDRDLDKIQAQIIKMGSLVETAIRDAATAYELRDLELARQVRLNDKTIDQFEESINDECSRLIALRAPTAVDLRLVLSVFKVSSNLERIGDYSKNIAKRTIVLEDLANSDIRRLGLKRLAREVELMLRDALDAYVNRDLELARDVIARDIEIDQMYNGLFREFLTYMMEDPRNITPCMHLHFMAKNMERMGDHVTTIAEQVVFLVTGQRDDDAREKGDVTSSDPEMSKTNKG